MSKRNYQHIQHLTEEILAMKAEGKTRDEIGAALGLTGIQVKNFTSRYNRSKRQVEKGIPPRPKGRPRKNLTTQEAQMAELERLRMENQLLRDFLQSTEI